MLPAAVIATFFACGQAALALPTVPSHSSGLDTRSNIHHGLAHSYPNKLHRRSIISKRFPDKNATESSRYVVVPDALDPAGGSAVAEVDLLPTEISDEPSTPTSTKAQTNDGGVTFGLNKSLRVLFPAAAPSSKSMSWSTNRKAPNPIDFSDSALGATNIMKLSHDVKTAPDGSKAMEIFFNEGSYNFKGPKGGFSFVAYGPDSVSLTNAREATFAYNIYFQENFQFNRGGKLPGLIGGDTDAAAKRCSGGHKAKDCFSARMMWRRDGEGELYAYIPPGLKGNNGVCDLPPQSHCNPEYGSSLGRGAFKWKTGGWTTMAQRVRLNDVGEANGEIEIFIDGESVIKATGMTLRQDGRGRIRAALVQSFFGGHDLKWASPRDQKFWLKDFSIAITEEL